MSIKIIISYTKNVTIRFNIQFAEPPFHIELINSSPRVGPNKLFADFTTSKPIVQAHCYFSGQEEQDCEDVLCLFMINKCIFGYDEPRVYML